MNHGLRRRIILFIGMATIGVTAGWKVFFQSAFLNRSTKEAFSQMHQTIHLGDAELQLDRAIQKLRTNRTVLRTDAVENSWAVEMPFEFRSGDRVLYFSSTQPKESRPLQCALQTVYTSGHLVHPRIRESLSYTARLEPKMTNCRGGNQPGTLGCKISRGAVSRVQFPFGFCRGPHSYLKRGRTDRKT